MKEDAKTRVKKRFKQNLRCALTDPEKITRGRELADANNELENLENDLAGIKAEYKAKTTAAQARLVVLRNTVTSGHEYREVDCVTFLDNPVPGKKSTVRLDTGETTWTKDMTEDEKQQELELPVGVDTANA